MSMTARQDEFSRVADDALDPLSTMKQDSVYDLPIKSFLSEKGSGKVTQAVQDAKICPKKDFGVKKAQEMSCKMPNITQKNL
jgi:hypothetical protein